MLKLERAVTAVAFVTLAACVNQPATSLGRIAENCGAPKGWEQIATAADHRVLIFGEAHGTNEIPDAFARYVCAASAREGRTLVLLEIDVLHEDALAMASEAPDPRSELVSTMPKHWASQDGRGSKAMLDMVERLVTLRQDGRDLVIRPMDQFTGWPEGLSPEELSAWFAKQPMTTKQQMRDRGMAEKIRSESEGFDRTIVLAGNVHARKAELAALPGVSLMAMLIPEAISLIAIHDGGTSWNNMDGLSGRVNETSRLDLVDAPADAMALTPERLPAYPGDAPAYDGYFSVGTITASPPALSSADTP
jgi:hypothetical protein